MADYYKKFETQTKARLMRLQPDYLGEVHKIPDGVERVKRGNQDIYIHISKMPADFMTYRMEDGKLVLVECKSVRSGSALTIEDDEMVIRRKKGFIKGSGSGLKNHQLHSLINLWKSGGVSLLLISFVLKNEVWAANGNTLLSWINEGDVKGNRSSMSHEHLKLHGYHLGNLTNWRICEHHLLTQKEATIL